MVNSVYIEEQLLQEADCILEKIGLDVSTIVKMTLKRIIRDRGISFLITDLPKSETIPVNTAVTAPTSSVEERTRITKSIAANLFKNRGHAPTNNVTFASKNKAGNYYWANPMFEVLKQDWFLILNDWNKQELHLFMIPGNTLSSNDLVCRADNEDKIDLQIAYNDATFTDNRSKISFLQFLKASITY